MIYFFLEKGFDLQFFDAGLFYIVESQSREGNKALNLNILQVLIRKTLKPC